MPEATSLVAPEPAHDAAWLRMVFNEAAEEWSGIFRAGGKLPAGWKPTREDVQIYMIWKRLYEAIVDTQAGVEVLGHIQRLEGRVMKLEEENARLQGLLPAAQVEVAK